MKFVNLLKKELRELLTKQMLVALVLPMIAYYFIGDFMGNVVNDIKESATNVTICNQDDSEFTKAILNTIEVTGNKVKLVDVQSDDYMAELKRLDTDELVIIPEGFSKTVLEDRNNFV